MKDKYINLFTDFGFEKAQIARFEPQEREAYESSLKYYRDLKNVIDTARDEGWEEGQYEKSLEIARNLLRIGGTMTDAQIAQATGLSEAEIATLRSAST